MKSVKLEWCLGDIRKARDLLDESVKHYPNFAKVPSFNMSLLCCLVQYVFALLLGHIFYLQLKLSMQFANTMLYSKAPVIRCCCTFDC